MLENQFQSSLTVLMIKDADGYRLSAERLEDRNPPQAQILPGGAYYGIAPPSWDGGGAEVFNASNSMSLSKVT